jgi:hypothetical protein
VRNLKLALVADNFAEVNVVSQGNAVKLEVDPALTWDRAGLQQLSAAARGCRGDAARVGNGNGAVVPVARHPRFATGGGGLVFPNENPFRVPTIAGEENTPMAPARLAHPHSHQGGRTPSLLAWAQAIGEQVLLRVRVDPLYRPTHP